MYRLKNFYLAFIIILLGINLVYSKPCFQVFGYLGYWNNPPRWSLNSIDWDALTHVIDSFAIPGSGGTLNSTDLRKSTLINTAHLNNTRAMFSVGGQTGSTYFSSICANPSARATLINNITNLFNDNLWL